MDSISRYSGSPSTTLVGYTLRLPRYIADRILVILIICSTPKITPSIIQTIPILMIYNLYVPPRS